MAVQRACTGKLKEGNKNGEELMLAVAVHTITLQKITVHITRPVSLLVHKNPLMSRQTQVFEETIDHQLFLKNF